MGHPPSEIQSLTSSLSNSQNPANILSGINGGPDGPVSYNLGNGLSGSYGYDAIGRLTGGWVCSGSTSPSCTGGTMRYGFTNGWSGVQLIGSSDSVLNQSSSYGYDEFNRLKSRTVNTGTVQNLAWTYDRFGNRWTQTVTSGSGPQPSYSFNAANNQITSTGFAYDAAGNMINDGSHTYTYDAEGNITKVDGGTTGTYTYDALNHRVKTIALINGVTSTTEFVFNASGQRVSTWNGATRTQLRGQYFWGSKPVAWYVPSSATHFQHQDWLGTERLRTTYNGAVEASLTSLPFGDALTPESGGDPYYFASLDYDSESATDHAQFRQYSSTQGRWMRPDPYYGSYNALDPQSMNRYAYVLNNPLALVDPSGLECVYDGYGNVTGYTVQEDSDGNVTDWLGGCAAIGLGADGSWTVTVTPDDDGSDGDILQLIPTVVAPNSGYPGHSYSILFCAGDALAANGVPLILDAASIAAGEIPGGATTVGLIKTAVTAGVGSLGTAYSTATSPNVAVGAANFTLGFTGTAASTIGVVDQALNGAAAVKAIPFLGSAISLFQTGVDVVKTYQAASSCVKSGKYD